MDSFPKTEDTLSSNSFKIKKKHTLAVNISDVESLTGSHRSFLSHDRKTVSQLGKSKNGNDQQSTYSHSKKSYKLSVGKHLNME